MSDQHIRFIDKIIYTEPEKHKYSRLKIFHMETFTDARPFVLDQTYERERKKTLSQLKEELKKGTIDLPIIELVTELAKIPHVFTLQSCYGHFVHDKEPNLHNIEPLIKYSGKIERVNYRIAYMALCIQDSNAGRQLFQDLQGLTKIDSKYIQFGSANWFWERHVNSYVIQAEPERSKNTDNVWIDFEEALHIEQLKRQFFAALFEITLKHQILGGSLNR